MNGGYAEHETADVACLLTFKSVQDSLLHHLALATLDCLFCAIKGVQEWSLDCNQTLQTLHAMAMLGAVALEIVQSKSVCTAGMSHVNARGARVLH